MDAFFDRKAEDCFLPCQYPNVLLKPTQQAPDFAVEAYCRGSEVTIRLSDFLEQWVVLFFYASDFTFV